MGASVQPHNMLPIIDETSWVRARRDDESVTSSYDDDEQRISGPSGPSRIGSIL